MLLKSIGSLTVACVLAVGTSAVADSATPENSVLYSIDRGFEKIELAFAGLSGNAAVAHKYLSLAEERALEIDVLLGGEASAPFAFSPLLIEVAYAQSIGANATLRAHIELLVEDCSYALQEAVNILEKIADSASATTRTKLAIAIETTSQSISQRLEASVQATAETDVRPVVSKGISTAKSIERQARNMQVQADSEVQAEAEVSQDHTMEDNDDDSDKNSDTSIKVDIDTGLPLVDIKNVGGLNMNLETGDNTQKNDSGVISETKTQQDTETSSESKQEFQGQKQTSGTQGTLEVDFSSTVRTKTTVDGNTETNTGIQNDINSQVESNIQTDIQGSTVPNFLN
ncbi:hypothetical protein COV83_04155 [Candidatus Peregrinibacteria bacterium CG11_big_fil_rev_8_21_14_0_20_49_14]|nr:MAG: hypothetical protein COV83_04155 [Candidatus Peregrinibacteria bacterium CG11_big_fil_rev_8_21_14_0_20_49_14]